MQTAFQRLSTAGAGAGLVLIGLPSANVRRNGVVRWIFTGDVDGDGNLIFKCSVCWCMEGGEDGN